MKRLACLFLLVATGCAVTRESDVTIESFHQSVIEQSDSENRALSVELMTSQNPHVRPYAAIIEAAKWTNPNIPVCWENPQQKFADAMNWTQDAVAKTWEAASKLRFTGWQRCQAINNGIHIQIDDSGPHVKTLGRLLNGRKHGMVLNFEFGTWSPDCASMDRLEGCIRSIAVHEFGHAVAFTHEQNRPDAPGECKPLAQGSDPDKMLTPYDQDSVMNYCNRKWNNDGFLSSKDTEAVQTLYGKP